MESCWTYPYSDQFQKSREAKDLCVELTKTKKSHLDATIEAMVADAKFQSDRKAVYYSKGKLRSDQEIMTDQISAEFDVVNTIKKTLQDDYNVSSRMSDIKQGQSLESMQMDYQHATLSRKNKTLEEFRVVLDDIREQCEDQLWKTIQEIAVTHEYDNEIIIENIKNQLELEMIPLQETYQEIQKNLDIYSLEYEKIKFAALQSYIILKKHNILPDKVMFNFSDNEESKVKDILKGLQNNISDMDDEILSLKNEISRLENIDAGNSRNYRSSNNGRESISESKTESITENEEENESIEALRGFVLPEMESEIAPDYSLADELERKYIKEIEKMKAENEKDLLELQETSRKKIKQWEIRTRSISNLHINTKLEKLVKKQNLLLNLATKARPRPDCHQQVTAHLSGTTLRQVNFTQLRTAVNDCSTSIHISDIARASVNEAFLNRKDEDATSTKTEVSRIIRRRSSFEPLAKGSSSHKPIRKNSSFVHQEEN